MLLAALWMFLLIIKIWSKENMGKYAGTHWHLDLFTDYAGFSVMILPPLLATRTSFLYLGYFKSFFTKNPTATIYSFPSSFLHILCYAHFVLCTYVTHFFFFLHFYVLLICSALFFFFYICMHFGHSGPVLKAMIRTFKWIRTQPCMSQMIWIVKIKSNYQ